MALVNVIRDYVVEMKLFDAEIAHGCTLIPWSKRMISHTRYGLNREHYSRLSMMLFVVAGHGIPHKYFSCGVFFDAVLSLFVRTIQLFVLPTRHRLVDVGDEKLERRCVLRRVEKELDWLIGQLKGVIREGPWGLALLPLKASYPHYWGAMRPKYVANLDRFSDVVALFIAHNISKLHSYGEHHQIVSDLFCLLLDRV